MEHDNGRRDSEGYSSSSDFYSESKPVTAAHNSSAAASLPLPPPQPSSLHHREETANTPDHHDADDEDSSDAMDLDSDSEPSPTTEHRTSHHAGSKRKASDIAPSAHSATAAEDDPIKKIKLSTPVTQDPDAEITPIMPDTVKARLPKEVWQHVFLYLQPAMLSRCLSVCRAFNVYLTKTTGTPVTHRVELPLSAKHSEAIWTHSRKTFYPSNFPRPLARCSERRMLELVGGRTCQFCHRQLTRFHATDPFHCGPGVDGLRTIWPLGIRTCGSCLEKNTVKDIELLKSNATSKDLRFGLPYIFLTPELHFIPASQRKLPGGIPPHLHANKVYAMRDMATITTEFNEAKSLGEGAAEEWRKGLQARGNSQMNDTLRWENWEASAPTGKDIAQVLREYDVTSFPRSTVQAHPWPVAGFMSSAQLPPAEAAHGLNTMQPSPSFQQYGYQNGYTYGPQYPVPNALYQQQPQRPLRDVEEIMATRQARQEDIERRCMELEPPLEARVLHHCQAYQNAMQISVPVTDTYWENMLKPKILAEREQAELFEHQRQERAAVLNAGFFAPGDLDYTKSGKELRDKEYEIVQQPLRQKLGEYAKELIDSKWNGGHQLDRDNCTAFAVDILLHVRKRFFQDKNAGLLLDLLKRSGPDQGKSIPELFLSLDSMKWVYENKIRPLTERLCKELFVCAECTAERKPTKWFAFESLIQHYGAKHTTAFSHGNVVVQWEQSEWPDDPPFFEHPLQLIVPDKKTQGRARNTPQAKRGPSNPPGPSRLLSENPLFAARGPHSAHRANGHDHPSDVESSYHYGGPTHSSAPSAEPSVEFSEAAQVTKLSNDAREIWDALDGVKDLLDCVRLQATIHHAVQRFWDKFRLMPNMDLLTDALATSSQIMPVKNASGLACQICVAERNPVYQSYYGRIQNVKLYAMSPLVTHFKLAHLSGPIQANWTQQMIELPEPQMITDLMSSVGMDDDKLAILAAAFPWAFPANLPRIGEVQESTQQVGPTTGLPSRALNKKQKPQGKKKRGRGASAGTPGAGGSSSESMHEYDPTRPNYQTTQDKPDDVDPARFDTDISRAREAASTVSSILNAPPGSLPSLNNFNTLQLQNQQHIDYDRERSPSVGRIESRNPTVQPTASGPAAQPDISSILASLMPHLQPMQTNTPPQSIRSDSGPKNPVAHPYGHPHSGPPNTFQDDQRPVTRYSANPSHRSSVEYSPQYAQQHLPAPAAHNMSSFHQNQVRTYVEPIYTAAHSPSRYRYVYDEAAAPHHHGAPVYREQPIQYVQLPPETGQSPAVASPHYYERPQPVRPVYVDAYGNPLVQLVPVDSAPAPIQYIPHPMEERQQRQFYAAPPSGASPPGSASRAPPGYYEYRG